MRRPADRWAGFGLALLAVMSLGAVAIILAINQPGGATAYEDEVPVVELLSGPPVTPTRLNRALKIATGYWHERCGTIRLRRRPLAKRLTIAQASWQRDGSRRYLDCWVTFNSRHKRLPFGSYCAAMVHEVGHLSGRSHSKDPSSVMFPRLSRLNVPRACKLVRDRQLVR